MLREVWPTPWWMTRTSFGDKGEYLFQSEKHVYGRRIVLICETPMANQQREMNVWTLSRGAQKYIVPIAIYWIQCNILSTLDIAIQYILALIYNILTFQSWPSPLWRRPIYCSSLSDTTNILFAPMDTTKIFIPTEFKVLFWDQLRRNVRRETFF
jgi:hypothetical protein